MKAIGLSEAKQMSQDANTTTFAMRDCGTGVYKVFQPSDLNGARMVEFYRNGYRTTYKIR